LPAATLLGQEDLYQVTKKAEREVGFVSDAIETGKKVSVRHLLSGKDSADARQMGTDHLGAVGLGLAPVAVVNESGWRRKLLKQCIHPALSFSVLAVVSPSDRERFLTGTDNQLSQVQVACERQDSVIAIERRQLPRPDEGIHVLVLLPVPPERANECVVFHGTFSALFTFHLGQRSLRKRGMKRKTITITPIPSVTAKIRSAVRRVVRDRVRNRCQYYQHPASHTCSLFVCYR
jgi:hypothetical protein